MKMGPGKAPETQLVCTGPIIGPAFRNPALALPGRAGVAGGAAP